MSKKRDKNIRKRFTLLNIEFEEKDINPKTNNIEVNIEFDITNGTTKVINLDTNKAIENKSIIYGYKGENKNRTTTEIETNPDDHSYCFKLKLEKYKHIIAIDTNTFSLESNIVKQEIKLGLGIGLVLLEKDDDFDIKPIPYPFVTSINCDKPENENWVRIIELLRRNCQCSDPRKIGVVVDSDLGNIRDYNNRDKPIFDDYFLPKEFELIFASDKVKDNVFNVMISQSHSISKKLIPNFIQCFKDAENNI